MKTLCLYFLIILSLMIGLGSCQSDELAPLHDPEGSLSFTPMPSPRPADKAPNPSPSSIPPAEVVRTDYTGATKWRITFENLSHENEFKFQRYFSFQNNTFYTYDEINFDFIAAAMADIDFVGKMLKRPYYDIYTNNKLYARETQFKLTDMGILAFYGLTNQPENLPEIFEETPYSEEPFLPLHVIGQSMWFKSGDIYLIKTAQSTPYYGAIHIVNQGSYYSDIPLIVEIIMQSDNHIIDLGS